MKIMYVEDNPANISLLQRIARMGGHEVINYTNGETALSNFEKDHADLVLMDLQLEGRFGGLDVVKQLRARGFKTPIVAVTAYAMVGDRERCIEAGCDSYLSKPLPVAELVEMVQIYEQKYKQPPVPLPVAPANGDKGGSEAPKAEPPKAEAPKAETPAVVSTVEKPTEASAAEPMPEPTKVTEEPTEPSRDAKLDLSAPRNSNYIADPAPQSGKA
jgi:two-component system cell cycle response regulator DivK